MSILYANRSQRNAFAEFLDRVDTAREQIDLRLPDREKPWFRGEGDYKYGLVPSLFREKELAPAGIGLKDVEAVNRYESDLFFEFQLRMGDLRRSMPSSWDLLFLMRHYGVPSRCLDWSERLGIAVYFALSQVTIPKNNDDSRPPTACVWLLNPYAFNKTVKYPKSVVAAAKATIKKQGRTDKVRTQFHRDTILPRYIMTPVVTDTKDWEFEDVLGYGKQGDFPKDPLAVCPTYANERMHAQAGVFTIHGTRMDSLHLCSGKQFCTCVQFMTWDEVRGAKLFLNDAGITQDTLFPGPEGIVQELKQHSSR